MNYTPDDFLTADEVFERERKLKRVETMKLMRKVWLSLCKMLQS